MVNGPGPGPQHDYGDFYKGRNGVTPSYLLDYGSSERAGAEAKEAEKAANKSASSGAMGIGGGIVALIILAGAVIGLTPNGLEKYFGIKFKDYDHQYNLHKEALVSDNNVILHACSDVTCPAAAHLPRGFNLILTSHIHEKGQTDGRFVDWAGVSIKTAGGNVINGFVDESQLTIGTATSSGQSQPLPTFPDVGIKTAPFYIDSDVVVVGGDVALLECFSDACKANGHLRSGQHVRVVSGPFDMPDSYAPHASHTIWYIVATCAANSGPQCASGSIRATRLKSAS
jgi:hypothetical protein